MAKRLIVSRSSTPLKTPEQSPKTGLSQMHFRRILEFVLSICAKFLKTSIYRLRLLAKYLTMIWARIWGTICWIFQREVFWTWFFRIGTALSVGWLIYDRIYEIAATISISASDPHDPMLFPFSLTNNSHIFKIRNMHWDCEIITLDINGRPVLTNSRVSSGSTKIIDEGQTVNFDCFDIGRSKAFDFGPQRITKIDLLVHVTYRAAFFRPLIQTTRFTWMGEASNPQWIRGDFVD
jgi:hypothetical protein